MKNWKNKVLGILTVIGLMSLLMGNYSNPPATANYEFYDLNDTRGIVFNKVTGEMEYKEIRTEPLSNLNTVLDNLSLSGQLDLNHYNGGDRYFN